MTTKRLMLFVLLAGVVGVAKPYCPKAVVGLGTAYALHKTDANPGLVKASVLAAATCLVNKHVGHLVPSKGLTDNVEHAALVAWVHSFVKAVTGNKAVEGHVRSVPVVGAHIADALFGDSKLKADVVALAAAVSGTLQVPYLNS